MGKRSGTGSHCCSCPVLSPCLPCPQSTHPPLKQDHLFYPVEWLHQVGYFDRGALPMPPYPAVPLPAHALPVFPVAASAEVRQQTLADLIQASGQRGATVNGASASVSTVAVAASPSSLVDRAAAPGAAQTQSLVHNDEDEGRNADNTGGGASAGRRETTDDNSSGGGGGGVWEWVSSKKVRTPLGVALFTLLVVLVAIVCFQLGKLCAPRRDDYQSIPETMPYAARGYGAREGFSRTGPPAVLSTR